jgi:hypothetical protein
LETFSKNKIVQNKDLAPYLKVIVVYYLMIKMKVIVYLGIIVLIYGEVLIKNYSMIIILQEYLELN